MTFPQIFVLALLAAGAAQATSIPAIPAVDFTDDVWVSGYTEQTLFVGTTAESIVTLNSNAGRDQINFRQSFVGIRDGVCANDDGVLACESDGLGVNDDEISRTGVEVAEEVTVSFSKAVVLQGLHFLDLFYQNKNKSRTTESALVFANGSADPLEFKANEKLGQARPGYLYVSLAPLVVTSLRFVPGQGNDTNNGAIKSGNRPDFALAAIEVTPVPLPLGAVFMLTAVGGGLVAWSRRRSA